MTNLIQFLAIYGLLWLINSIIVTAITWKDKEQSNKILVMLSILFGISAIGALIW